MVFSQNMLRVDNALDYDIQMLEYNQNDHITDSNVISTAEHNLLLGCEINLVNVISISFVWLLDHAIKCISYCGLQWKYFIQYWASSRCLDATTLGWSTFFFWPHIDQSPFITHYYTLLALLSQSSGGISFYSHQWHARYSLLQPHLLHSTTQPPLLSLNVPYCRAFALAVSCAWNPSHEESTHLTPYLPLSLCSDVNLLIEPTLTALFKLQLFSFTNLISLLYFFPPQY